MFGIFYYYLQMSVNTGGLDRKIRSRGSFLENLTNDNGYAGSSETRNPERKLYGSVLW